MKTFVAILLLILLSAGYWPTMNYYGYCHDQRKFLDNDAFIQIALNEAEQRNKSKKGLPYVNYKDAAEILKQNPNCCSVDRKKLEIPFVTTILGGGGVAVYVDYVGRFGQVGEVKKEEAVSYAFMISNCGFVE